MYGCLDKYGNCHKQRPVLSPPHPRSERAITSPVHAALTTSKPQHLSRPGLFSATGAALGMFWKDYAKMGTGFSLGKGNMTESEIASVSVLAIWGLE